MGLWRIYREGGWEDGGVRRDGFEARLDGGNNEWFVGRAEGGDRGRGGGGGREGDTEGEGAGFEWWSRGEGVELGGIGDW